MNQQDNQKRNIAVLISGRGSNLQAIIDSIENGQLAGVNLAVVISNKDGVQGLERARKHNIPVFAVDHNGSSREEHEKKIIEILKQYDIELVVLAGYMRLLTSFFLGNYPNRVINIHPSLLPSFPGTKGYEDALNYGVKITGCTVHFVNEGMDTGKIILQKIVPIEDGDTVETLEQRGLKVEHEAFPEAIQKVVWLMNEGKI